MRSINICTRRLSKVCTYTCCTVCKLKIKPFFLKINLYGKKAQYNFYVAVISGRRTRLIMWKLAICGAGNEVGTGACKFLSAVIHTDEYLGLIYIYRHNASILHQPLSINWLDCFPFRSVKCSTTDTTFSFHVILFEDMPVVFKFAVQHRFLSFCCLQLNYGQDALTYGRYTTFMRI